MATSWTPDQPIVQCVEVRKSFGALEVLKGISLSVRKGEVICIIGPSGSGKSTLIRCINALQQISSGSIQIEGIEVTDPRLDKLALRRKVGMVFQDSDSQLFVPTVSDDVLFGLLQNGVAGPEAVERALAALERVGMRQAAARAPYHLSAGEKKRVAIAGVLAMEPEILVLDEPTTFLDPPAQRELTVLLGGLPQPKILVTHDVRLAGALCSRAAFFDAGQIVAVGTVAEIVRRFQWD